MKTVISLRWQPLRPLVESLHTAFDRQGELLHAGRNCIKAFDSPQGRIVVKRFGKPSLINQLLYGFLRKSKAQRAYEHAQRLHTLGIDTPEPIAWCQRRHHGMLVESYFVAAYTDFAPLSQATAQLTDPTQLAVLDAFSRFAIRMHQCGIEHKDFNQGNILWKRDPQSGEFRFQLIDINRMRFTGRPLPPQRCMINLRRLACPAVAFLYVLDRYAENRGWNINDTLLQGTFFRLLFGRRKELRKRFLHGK